MMKILISNDDGVHARGLDVLAQAFSKVGKVWVVAPLDEKSTTGHSLTIHKPLRIIHMEKNKFGVSGSPADCVYLGVREVMKVKPDIVISGINRGGNMGQDVYYSGTVSAAREACMMGIPSLAVSLAVQFNKNVPEEKLYYETAAKFAVKVVKDGLMKVLPKFTLWNLNSPDSPITKVKGLKIARQGFRFYSGSILKRRDHRGKDYFWVGGQYQGFKEEPGTDCFEVDHHYATLTPLKLDTTDFETLRRVRSEFNK